MTQTTNYDLNLVEGTDKVNPLTQMNPNFEKIDEEMKKNADGGITVATELLTGSIHGLLRTNADCPMLRFTATSNYTAGDTFTVDGIQVTALTPTGEALATGAYIIGSEVIGCLKGTLLTLFISGGVVTTADNALKLGGEEPAYYATSQEVAQAQSTANAAGVLANSVQTQVTELAGKVSGLDLLWTNINHGTASASYIANIPTLQDYDYIKVAVKQQAQSAGTPSNGNVMFVDYPLGAYINYHLWTFDGGRLVRRRFEINDTDITFFEGYIYNSYNATTSNNNACVPLAIYGGKYNK